MAFGREQLRKLIDDLGEIPKDLQRELRPAIRKAAQPVLGQMREDASWSTRIPPATQLSTSFTTRRPGVRIVANARQAPHARPYEGLSGEVFRHPVYGHYDRWVPQKARPFFFRAVRQKAGEVTESIGAVIDEITARHGF